MPRAVTEWIGATDDSKPPVSVRLRVFSAYGGRCYLSGRLIRPGDKWELEHVRPLHMYANGNRETNLAPALVGPHSEKSNDETAVRAKCDRVRAKHLGVFPKPKRRLQSRGFQ